LEGWFADSIGVGVFETVVDAPEFWPIIGIGTGEVWVTGKDAICESPPVGFADEFCSDGVLRNVSAYFREGVSFSFVVTKEVIVRLGL
jgi:hypothetical protein